MKKYLLSILLVFAVIVGTVFATTMTASAATASSITVCGVTMNNGTYLASGASSTTTTKPSGGYAYYYDGYLTLYKFTGTYSGAYAVYCNGDLNIRLSAGTSNSLTTTSTSTGAAGIYVNGNLSISNTGSLSVTGGKYAIQCKQNLYVYEGTLNCSNSGLYANGNISIMTAVTVGQISNQAKGAHCIHAVGDVDISGGSVTINSPEAPSNYAVDGIVGGNVNISGGAVTIHTCADGISSNGNVTISAGSVNADAGGDAVFASGTLTFSGGLLRAYGNCDGVDVGTLKVTGGNFYAMSESTSNDNLYSAVNVSYNTSTYFNVASNLAVIGNAGTSETGAFAIEISQLSNYDYIRIGKFIMMHDVVVPSGYYIESGNSVTKVSTTAPSSGKYAYYNNGVLTLNNYSYSGNSVAIRLFASTSINLSGGSELNHIVASAGDVTLYGSGALTIKTNLSTSGIYTSGNVYIQGGRITVESDDTGITCDSFTQSAGFVWITARYNGIELFSGLSVTGGAITIKSTGTTNDTTYRAVRSISANPAITLTGMNYTAGKTANVDTIKTTQFYNGDYDFVALGEFVIVRGVVLYRGHYLFNGDAQPYQNQGSHTEYAYLKDKNTLILKNYSFSGSAYGVASNNDLNIVLEGASISLEAKGDYRAIYVNGNLTISKTTGFTGKMTVKSANDEAIDIYGNFTIDGADVTVTTSNNYCVGVSGNLTVNSGSFAATCTYTGTTYAYNSLVVNGDLIANAGSLKVTAPTNKGGAVVVKGNATFKGGTHTITSATGNAIELPNGYLSVQGGDLTVSGGENGIKLTTGRLNMNGGFLIIKSTNTASDSSYSALKVAGTDSNYYNVASSLGQAASTGSGKSGLKKVARADLSTYDYIQIGDFVEIGGTTVRSGYSITASGTVSSGNYGTGSIYYSNGVLTINQFNYVTDTHRGIEAYKDVTMKVTGDSSIVVTGSYYGVVIYGNVTLTGTEKLTSSSNSNGMCVYGSMTVSGPEVVVNGNNNAVSGLYITGNLTVNSGMVTGDSGKDNGIYVLGNMTVTGGEVYAEGGLNGVRVNGKFTLTGGILKALSFDTTNDSSYAALKLAGTSGSYYSVSSSLMQMASTASNANTLSELVITKLGDYDYVIIGDGIFVGDVLVPTGYYLVQGATKPVTSTSANNYVYYNNGTLKVNNFTFDGEHFIRTSGDLTLNVYGTNSATCYSNHIIVDGDLTVNGTGSLQLETDKSFAVLVCGGNMTLSNATVTIKSTGPIGAIRLDHNGDSCGDGNLTVNSGKLTVEAQSSHSNNKTIIARDVNIKGGTVTVTSGYVPFWNGGIMNISGGTVTIAGDVCGVTWAYNAYEKVMNITGGNVLITSTDVAIDDYNITLNVSGGELSVTGTEKAIYVDECNITGGTVIAKSTGTNSVAIDSDVFNVTSGLIAMGSNYSDGSNLSAVTSSDLSKCKYVKVSPCNHLDVTTDKDHKCDICGLDGVTIHEYDHTEHDNTYHYAVCNCGVKYITEEHSYVNDKCSCGKNAPAFGIQPAGGEVMAGEEFTVRWTLNFTATKSEVHYVTNRGGTVFVKTISGSATSTTLPARAENYIIVAYYNDTQYVVSGLFKISEMIVTHSVTFDNGGVITTQSVNNGQTIAKPADPVVEGKNFLGWYTEAGNLFDFSTPITGDIKLIAKFADVIQKFDIDVARMILGNSLEFQFGVAQSKIPDKTGFYAIVEKSWADGSTTQKTIPATQWSKAGIYYAIVYDGLAAKEMGDAISVTIYNKNNEAVSNPKNDSVRSYVARAFASQSDAGKTMMVDMLNYGAAAQQKFSYNTTDLANNQLTATQLTYGTVDVKPLNNNQVKGDNFLGTRFVLESRIQVQIAFSGLTSDMYAVYSYTDCSGNLQEIRVEGEDFITAGNMKGVELSNLVYADARTVVKVLVYKADGTLYAGGRDSIESCAYRSTTGDDVFIALMKFADSAKEYLY